MKFININMECFNRLHRLTESEKACLLDCIVNYAREGVLPDEATPPIVDILFSTIQKDMDYSNAKYEAQVERAQNLARNRRKGKEDTNRTQVVHESYTNRTQVATSNEHHETKKKDKKKDKDKIYSNDDSMNLAITRWFAYKKERGEAYKPIGEESFITKLEKLSGGNGEIAMQIVENSISNNYQGIFPLKQSTIAPEVGQILQGAKDKDYKKGGWQ